MLRTDQSLIRRCLPMIGITALTVLPAGAGCTQMAYDTLRNTQAGNCRQMQSSADRDACLQRSNMSYDEYRRELDKSK